MDHDRDRVRAQIICFAALFGGPALIGIAWAYNVGGGIIAMAVSAGMAMFASFAVIGISGSLMSYDFSRKTTSVIAWIALFAIFGLAAAGLIHGRELRLYDELLFEHWAPWVGGGVFAGGMAYMMQERRSR